jgi:hypothetical protein
MANEITIAASLLASKGGASVNTGSQLKALTMTGGDMYQATQNIDTTYEALVFGDITQPAGQMFIRNLDATNYIELALDTAFTNKISQHRCLRRDGRRRGSLTHDARRHPHHRPR